MNYFNYRFKTVEVYKNGVRITTYFRGLKSMVMKDVKDVIGNRSCEWFNDGVVIWAD